MSHEQKFLKAIRVFLLVGIITAAVVFYGVQWWLTHPRKQPIAFMHSVHAGQRQISCYFCHSGVEKGDMAGVPSVQDCMQCHQVVATDNPEVQKLTGYWQRKESIAWYKNYRMPKHVHFSHKVHVAYLSKKYPNQLSCEVCHGDVTKMNVITPAHNLSMGFCVNCHRENNAMLDCTACHR